MLPVVAAGAGDAVGVLAVLVGDAEGAAVVLAEGAAVVLAEGAAVVLAAALGSAGVPLPPAAFSNSVRCERNSTSFARIAGSIATVPDVPTAPAARGPPGSETRRRADRPRAR